MIEITDVDDERVSFFQSLRGNAARIVGRGLILVEGDQQIERLLKTDLEIQTLFMERRFYERFADALMFKTENAERFVASREVMEGIIGYRLHQGAMALAKKPEAASISSLSLPIVVLNHLADPENVGAIVRSCGAFGIRSMLVDSSTADPYLRRAIRVSMGAIFEMRVAYSADLRSDLLLLSNRAEIVALEASPEATPIEKFQFRTEMALIVGNERAGIDRSILSVASATVTIPMDFANVGSLNVGAATAIALHYLARVAVVTK